MNQCGLVVGIAVLSLGQIPFDDGAEFGVEEESSGQPVEERGEPADGGHSHNARGPNHPSCLGQGRQPIRAIGEMVERPEEQDSVEGCVLEVQMACITHLSDHPERTERGQDRVRRVGE